MTRLFFVATRAMLWLIAFVVVALMMWAGYVYITGATPEPRKSCKEKHIFDKVFIDIAVKERDARTQSTRKNQNVDFDIENPNCCRVLRGESSRKYKDVKDFYNYPFQIVVVELNNETSRKDINKEGGVSKDTVLMDDCGRVTDTEIALLPK